MAELTTTKKINVSQFSHEIGGKPLHVLQGAERTIISFNPEHISEGAVEAAINAHQPDSAWTPPARPPTSAETDRARKSELAQKPVLTPAEQQEAIRLLLRGV